MQRTHLGAVVVVAGSVFLSGCSETGFQDLFGAGKYSPDESQVHQNQSLAMPPDLQLKPPHAAERQVAPDETAYAPPQTTQPPLYDSPEQDYAPQQTYTRQQPAQQQVATQQPPVYQQPDRPKDVYERLGVSRTRPDGSKKSQSELNEELRQKKMAEEKARNPNYGTIWNMGQVWEENRQ